MVRSFFVIGLLCLVGLMGCTSPEKRKAEAEAEIAEEKVKIMKRYSECLTKNEGQENIAAKCAAYKEATEGYR